jgi:hypothetical protein
MLEHGIIWIALTGQKLWRSVTEGVALGYYGARFQRDQSEKKSTPQMSKNLKECLYRISSIKSVLLKNPVGF